MSIYFNEAKQWRSLVTDRAGKQLTVLDRLATQRSFNYVLGGPAEARGRVPSDNPQVNILNTDGQPFVEEGDRLLYCFRREAPGGGDPWVIRFSGILQQLEDATRTEDATSAYVAYDPWQYCFSRPCRNIVNPTSGAPAMVGLIGADGLRYLNTSPAQMVREQLALACMPLGSDPYTIFPITDAPIDQLYLIDGTIDLTIPPQTWTIQQGTSVGQLMQDVMSQGWCDVTIDPLYDPLVNPGMLGILNVVAKAGSYKPTAIFAWDKPKRSLVGVSKLVDGTRRTNRMRIYGAQGGAPVPTGEDSASQAAYGIYEEDQFMPGLIQPEAYVSAAQLASQEVQLRKNGAITYTVDPAAERSPMPLRDYALGDWMPLYWSSNLREASSLVQRVVGIPIELDDNGLEVVRQLLVIVSDEDQPQGFSGGPPAIGAGGIGSGVGPGDPGLGPAGGGSPAGGPVAPGAAAGVPRTTSGFIRPFRSGP